MKKFAVYSTITEGNKVDGKVLWKQVVFNVTEEEANRMKSKFSEVFVIQRKFEEDTIKAFKKEHGIDLHWKINAEGYYCWME